MVPRTVAGVGGLVLPGLSRALAVEGASHPCAVRSFLVCRISSRTLADGCTVPSGGDSIRRCGRNQWSRCGPPSPADRHGPVCISHKTWPFLTDSLLDEGIQENLAREISSVKLIEAWESISEIPLPIEPFQSFVGVHCTNKMGEASCHALSARWNQCGEQRPSCISLTQLQPDLAWQSSSSPSKI